MELPAGPSWKAPSQDPAVCIRPKTEQQSGIGEHHAWLRGRKAGQAENDAATQLLQEQYMKKFRRLAALGAFGASSLAAAASNIVVHRDPGCGCCEKWAAQAQQRFGRRVTLVDDARRSSFQRARGVPPALSSCHTAIVDGIVFEGHVPIADMKHALALRPRRIAGLAVPGMPLESPGMEIAGQHNQHYDVIAFGASGAKIFARR